MLAVDRAWPGIARQKNSTLFLTSALISSAATGAVFGWEALRGRKHGKGIVEQVIGDIRKTRRVGKTLFQTVETWIADTSVPLRRPILPDEQQQEAAVFEPIGPPVDDSGRTVASITSPFVLTPPDAPSPPFVIQLAHDVQPDTTDITTVQPEDQAEARTRRTWFEQLPGRSLHYIRSLPFRFAAWRDERRDLKLSKDVEYYYRCTPMGYNK